MTCIIALEHENKVYMGCDSAAASGWDMQPTALKKVFRVGEFLIGYTSSFRMGQLLEHHLEVREEKDEDDLNYLVTVFIPAVRTCLKDGGYTKINDNQEEGGIFLVGYRGKAYKVNSDFQVNRFRTGFIATGCGEKYALGALAAQEIINPERAIMKALEIAGMFSNGVCGPYFVMGKE